MKKIVLAVCLFAGFLSAAPVPFLGGLQTNNIPLLTDVFVMVQGPTIGTNSPYRLVRLSTLLERWAVARTNGTLSGTTTTVPSTYTLLEGLFKIPRPAYQAPYVADELYAFGLSETVNYNGTSNLVYYIVSYNLTPGGSRKDTTKPGWAWVVELNFQVAGQTNKIEEYIRYVGTDGTDWRPQFKVFGWDGGLNHSINGGLYLSDRVYTLFTTFNTDGGNAGRIWHNGSMELFAFPGSGNRPYAYLADRGSITWDNSDETISFFATVDPDNFTFLLGGNESNATNFMVRNFSGTPTPIVFTVSNATFRVQDSGGVNTFVTESSGLHTYFASGSIASDGKIYPIAGAGGFVTVSNFSTVLTNGFRFDQGLTKGFFTNLVAGYYELSAQLTMGCSNTAIGRLLRMDIYTNSTSAAIRADASATNTVSVSSKAIRWLPAQTAISMRVTDVNGVNNYSNTHAQLTITQQ